MRFPRLLKYCLWLGLAGFVLVNVVAAFHAYKFTHFTLAKQAKTANAHQLSFAQKVGIVLFGVSNPRPLNWAKPTVPYQVVKLQSNKTIAAWHIPVDGAKGTVILFHGYGGSKSGLLTKAAIFRSLGYSTFLVDFMGSGGSEGNQTTIGYREAEQVQTAIDYVATKGEHHIVLFGTSMGAVASMKAMAAVSPQRQQKLPVQGLILECPFSTMLQTTRNRFAAMGLPAFPMAHLLVFWGGALNGFNAFFHNPLAYAQHIRQPVLLLHGNLDPKVTAAETQLIFDSLPSGKKTLVTLPRAGHDNYLEQHPHEWTEAVANFLEKTVAPTSLAEPANAD